jgi:hypothetical protein
MIQRPPGRNAGRHDRVECARWSGERLNAWQASQESDGRPPIAEMTSTAVSCSMEPSSSGAARGPGVRRVTDQRPRDGWGRRLLPRVGTDPQRTRRTASGAPMTSDHAHPRRDHQFSASAGDCRCCTSLPGGTGSSPAGHRFEPPSRLVGPGRNDALNGRTAATTPATTGSNH